MRTNGLHALCTQKVLLRRKPFVGHIQRGAGFLVRGIQINIPRGPFMPGVARMVHRKVGGNPVEPGGELGLGPVALPGAVNAHKNLLRQLFGNCLVAHHPEKKVDDGPVILLGQITESRFVARRRAQHDGRVACGIEADRVQPAGRSWLPVRPLSRVRSQKRVVQDQGCHILWNPIRAGMLRRVSSFRVEISVCRLAWAGAGPVAAVPGQHGRKTRCWKARGAGARTGEPWNRAQNGLTVGGGIGCWSD